MERGNQGIPAKSSLVEYIIIHTHTRADMHALTYAHSHAHMYTCACTHAHICPYAYTQAHVLTHTANLAFASLVFMGWQLPISLLQCTILCHSPLVCRLNGCDGLLCHCTPNKKQEQLAMGLILLYLLFIIYIVLLLPSSGVPLRRLDGLISLHSITSHLALFFHHLLLPWSLGLGGYCGEGSELHI